MLSISRDVPLAPLTTFRIGGAARFFARIESESDLVEALQVAECEALPLFVIGGGSNLLIPDEDFPGLALHLAIKGPLERNANLLRAPAGIQWDDLVLHVCHEGLSGMECLAGIPGLVGGSPIQNIGAYGQEVSQTIHSVRAYDREQKRFVILSREDCRFAYRQSIFNTTQRNRYLMTQVTFAFDPQAVPPLSYPDLRAHFAGLQSAPTPLEVYEAIRMIRQAKGMLLLPDGVAGSEDTRSAGSFFKNPIVSPSVLATVADTLHLPQPAIPHYPAASGNVKLSAAWLLENTGFHKSFADGEAGISSRHTLALINRGRATYADIARLRDRITQAVQAKFAITLEQEPVEP